MTPKQYRIQIVEDDDDVAEILHKYITKIGHIVVNSSSSGKDAIYFAGEMNPDLILMDIELIGETDGIETAKQLKSLHNIPLVFVTGNYDNATIERAKEAEPLGYLIKPVDAQELKITIEFAVYKHRLQMEKENLIADLTDSVKNILNNYANSDNLKINPHEWFR